MSRATFPLLVFPSRREPLAGGEFAVFPRADQRIWQGIAGFGGA